VESGYTIRCRVGLGERTRPRVRRLTPRQPRPRAPSRVDPAWPGTRNFGISPANRRRAGFPACCWPAELRLAGFQTCVPWPSRNGFERGCAPQATGFLLFGDNIPLKTAKNQITKIKSFSLNWFSLRSLRFISAFPPRFLRVLRASALIGGPFRSKKDQKKC